MIPILYAKNATNFDNNGIGHLKDAISCKVTEERNGNYTLTLQYPVGGAWYDSISEGAVIKAKANETSELQLFRIYKSSKPMKSGVTFSAEHISYDLQGLPIASLSLTDTTAEAALSAGFDASLLPHGFTAWSDIETLNSISFTTPRSLRNLCGGKEDSVLDVWGGEFEFDNFLVKLHKNRGANRGVVINYGKNLTDAKQERNISECYTHFFPYAIKKNGETEETVTLPEGIIELIDPENIGHTRAYPLDITNELPKDAEINQVTLRKCAEEYIKAHKLGVPEVNITLSLMQIWDSPEYVQKANGERISLCDTVTVRFHELGIDAEAKVIKTEYDSLAERYSKIEVGDARSSLADTVVGVKESIDQTNKNLAESKNAASAELQKAIEDATKKITGNSGGYVVLYPPNNPQEILVMDSPHIETAKRVWRWNSSGLGYSKEGYNGSYGLAMTMDGAIVADFITAGTLKAINISGCTIKGGSLNVNNNFIVDSAGNVQLNGNVTWGTGASPTQAVYAQTMLQKPSDNTPWNSFPESDTTDTTTWHRYCSSTNDYFACYTYDGGITWTSPIQIRGINGLPGADGKDGVNGKDGANGKDGVNGKDGDSVKIVYLYYRQSTSSPPNAPSYDGSSLPSGWSLTPKGVTSVYLYEFVSQSTVTNGSYGAWSTPVIWAKYGADGTDATVTSQNVFNALTHGGEMYGCFTAQDGKLYINADYINAGTLSSDLTFTGKIVAQNALITGGTIGGCSINDGKLVVPAANITGYLSAPQIYSYIDEATDAKAQIYYSNGYFYIKANNANDNTYDAEAGVNIYLGGRSAYTELYSHQTDESGNEYNTSVFCGKTGNIDITASRDIDIKAPKVKISGITAFSSEVDFNLTDALYFKQEGSLTRGRIAFRPEYAALAIETDYDGANWAAMLLNASTSRNNIFMGSWEFSNGEPSYGSDRNIKTDIEDISDKYSAYFDNLRVKTFKYLKGNSGRTHTGLVAQDAYDALSPAGLTSQDFAGVCVRNEGTEQELWTIRSGEFVALCIHEIQKLKKAFAELKT